MALDELAELFAVFIAHVDEFHAVAVLADVANHRGEIDLAKASAHFQLNGVAHGEFPRRLEISTTQADGLYTSQASRGSFNFRPQRRLQRHAHVTARNEVA